MLAEKSSPPDNLPNSSNAFADPPNAKQSRQTQPPTPIAQ